KECDRSLGYPGAPRDLGTIFGGDKAITDKGLAPTLPDWLATCLVHGGDVSGPYFRKWHKAEDLADATTSSGVGGTGDIPDGMMPSPLSTHDAPLHSDQAPQPNRPHSHRQVASHRVSFGDGHTRRQRQQQP